MLQGFLVPNALFVENEFLVGLCAAETHVLIVEVPVPNQRSSNLVSIYFFQVFDVHIHTVQFSELHSFVEYYLLCVGQQLCMEGENMQFRPTARNWTQSVSKGQHEQSVKSAHPQCEGRKGVVIPATVLKNVGGCNASVEQNSVLMTKPVINSELIVIHRAVETFSHKIPDKGILQTKKGNYYSET